MSVRLREDLAGLPNYVAGRAVPGAVKLASNETPFGPLPHVLERIASAAANVNRYPDNYSLDLRGALAAKFGVPAEHVAVGGGSVALCHQLAVAAAGPGDEVLYSWRSFETYPIVAQLSGARSVQIPLRDQAFDLDAMSAAVTDRTRLVFVCNPNNPSSTALPFAEIERFVESVPSDVLLVLDEAYIEFATDPAVHTGQSLLAAHPNVVLLRTFSKAYGLAGLRVGYAIAADETIPAVLRQTQVPFAVTALSQTAAVACLEPQAEKELAERVAEVTTERERVAEELRRLGYAVPTSQANFVWIPSGAPSDGGVEPAAFGVACEDAKVITRVFTDAGVRVTIGTAEENDQFLAAAASVAPGR